MVVAKASPHSLAGWAAPSPGAPPWGWEEGARTGAETGRAGAVERAKVYAATGVDAIFLVGVEAIDQVQAVHEAVKLPIIVGSAPASLKREDLAARGARIVLQGHQPVAAAVKALQETYTHLFNGGAPADLKSKVASPQEMERLVNADAYRKWQREYLH